MNFDRINYVLQWLLIIVVGLIAGAALALLLLNEV